MLALPRPSSAIAQASIASEDEPSSASTLPSPSPAGGLFRIAHLRSDPDSPLDAGAFERLRAFLASLPAMRAALSEEGLRPESLAVVSADSPQVLIEWMSLEQADLVFCPAVALRLQEGGRYDVAFQLRRYASPSSDRVWTRGAIFVNNRSPLYGKNPTPQALADYLTSGAPHPIAMASSFSAAGYVYPWLRLADLTQNQEPRSVIFCGSAEEVVRSVINGVAEIGAAPDGVMEEVVDRAFATSGTPSLTPRPGELLQVVSRTEPAPTDPIAFRARWRPRGNPDGRDSPVGREAREGIRLFFQQDPRLPRLVPSSNDRFDALGEALQRQRELWKARWPKQ